jgi:Tfp pilus assembly protein PilV
MHNFKNHNHGITLAETVISMLLISFVLVSTLSIVGPMARSTTVHADRLVASNLANEMAEEIATKLFIDPNAADPDALGADADDGSANRIDFDDIDDYQNWSSSPPSLSAGSPITSLSNWTRSVTIEHAVLAEPSTASATNTGLKRVTITVTKNGVKLAQIVTLHSQSADTLGFIVPMQSTIVIVDNAIPLGVN